MTSPLNTSNSNTSNSPVSRSVSSTPPPTQGYFNTNFLDPNNRMRVHQEEFENVTHIFDKGCQSLKLGELVHSPYFGLLDAMAACEIMDPKMDSGYLNLSNLLNDYNVNSDLSYNNLLAILDKLFSLQIEWFFGNPPLQTLFTSYYFHYQTPQLSYSSNVSNLIFSFCHLIRLTCHFISNQLSEDGSFYEGEDFSNQLPHNVKWSQVPPYDEPKWVTRSEELVVNLIEGLSIRDKVLDLIIIRFKLQLLLLKISFEFYSSRNIEKIRDWAFESLQLIDGFNSEFEFSESVVDSAFNFNLSNLISGQVPPKLIKHWEFQKVKSNYKSFLKGILFISNLTENPFGIKPNLNQFSGLSLDKLLQTHASKKNCTIIQVWLQSLLVNRDNYFGTLASSQFIPLYIEWFYLDNDLSLLENDYLKPVWQNLQPLISDSIMNQTKNISRQRREANKLIGRWEICHNNTRALLLNSNLKDYLIDENITKLAKTIENFLIHKKFNLIEKILKLSFSLNLVKLTDFKLNLIYLEHILSLNLNLISSYSQLGFSFEDFNDFISNEAEINNLNLINFKRLRIFVVGLEIRLKLELVSCLIKELELANRDQLPLLPSIDLPNYEHITYRNRFRMFENLEDKLTYTNYLQKLDKLKQMSEIELKDGILVNLQNSKNLISNLLNTPATLKGIDCLLKVENDKYLERLNFECEFKLKNWQLINQNYVDITSFKDFIKFNIEEKFPYLSTKFNI